MTLNMESDSTIRPWPTIATKPAGNFRIFTIRSDTKVAPRTGRQHDFYVIDCVNWVNACAVTSEGQLVMIEQYRHGSDTIELEVPGGMLDPHETDPVGAALRELREETGYTGSGARIIGEMFPNAAIMSNRCHTVLVENARLTHPTEFDHGEDIAVRLVPLEDIPRLAAEGRIRHAIVLAALHHFDLWRRGFVPPGLPPTTRL
jgi:ADP-ribose pyrophosphatase